MKKKLPRPNGKDINRYKGMEKWSYRKWAWEFLRRNNDFILACKKCEVGTDDEKQAIANQFGLLRFKDYRDPYTGSYGKPKFTSDLLTSWSNQNGDRSSKSIELEQGMVLVRFDLNASFIDTQSLDKQLQLAKGRLKKRLKEYSEKLNKKTVTHHHSFKTFGIYIRLLDLLANRKTYAECARDIEPIKSADKTKEELSENIKQRIKKAREYTTHGYRFLALHPGKPGEKVITLGEIL
ncbi:MAG: hypothetical protein KG003_05645 [Bacteroidetes bacterium]|nr:hypothetical protein [Bacteroidota bacterium]